ncbi:hypothetical protein V8J36_08570 [Frigidibacter sp. MR17.14]|uniref:hypothetical protein n=1 Tax=Frigidibacter sp. MR17.14 TaxID=3126509 RepID=UPI003012B703
MQTYAFSEQVLSDFNDIPSKRVLKDMIMRTNLSADTKALLIDIADFAIKVGTTALAIGRKVLQIALAAVNTLPSMTVGMIVALLLAMLIASVPLVGGTMAAVLGPLLLALGLTNGAIQDLTRSDVGKRFQAFIARVQELTEMI